MDIHALHEALTTATRHWIAARAGYPALIPAPAGSCQHQIQTCTQQVLYLLKVGIKSGTVKPEGWHCNPQHWRDIIPYHCSVANCNADMLNWLFLWRWMGEFLTMYHGKYYQTWWLSVFLIVKVSTQPLTDCNWFPVHTLLKCRWFAS